MNNVIGNAIGRYRRERNMSQKELAALCGITPTYMSQIEKGRKMPSFSLLDKLCNNLQIKQQDLYKNLFIESILNADNSDEQKEIIVLLQVLLEKVSGSSRTKNSSTKLEPSLN